MHGGGYRDEETAVESLFFSQTFQLPPSAFNAEAK